MVLVQKFKRAFNQSKKGGLNKIVKFEHSGCIYGVQYTGDHRGDRVAVYRCLLGEDLCGYALIRTRNLSKAVFEIMTDSQWHRYHKINEFKNRSRSFRKLNHLYTTREQWMGGECFMSRGSIEYTWIKDRLPWETKYNIFNGVIQGGK